MATVFKKLNLKDQDEILVLNAPASFEREFRALRGVTIRRDLRSAGGVDFSLAFVTTQKEVDRLAQTVARRAEGDTVVWFAYPKKTSKNYTCEFERDSGWRSLGEAGFEGVRQVAIDEDWSAIRFRRVKFIKTMTRDKTRAMTRKGKTRAAGRKP